MVVGRRGERGERVPVVLLPGKAKGDGEGGDGDEYGSEGRHAAARASVHAVAGAGAAGHGAHRRYRGAPATGGVRGQPLQGLRLGLPPPAGQHRGVPGDTHSDRHERRLPRRGAKAQAVGTRHASRIRLSARGVRGHRGKLQLAIVVNMAKDAEIELIEIVYPELAL